MNELRKAAEMALEALEKQHNWMVANDGMFQIPSRKAINALRQALAQPEQEPVTLLPDGSAFGVISFPLPDSHWLYAEREYRDGEHEPIELGKPILTHELRDAVVSAVRYAIRGATNCGKEMDFDPDALVQNAVYALCGPYTPHVDAVNMSQERVDETAKGEHEPVWGGSMNKRIKELAEQCTTQYRDGNGGYIDQLDTEKFAELIVKECIHKMLNSDDVHFMKLAHGTHRSRITNAKLTPEKMSTAKKMRAAAPLPGLRKRWQVSGAARLRCLRSNA